MDVPAVGGGGEQRNIAPPQLRHLAGHQVPQFRALGQHSEGPVPVGSGAHRVRVGRFGQQRRVDAGVAEHHPLLGPGAVPQRPAVGQQLGPVRENGLVGRAEPADQTVDVGGRFDVRRPGQARPVAGGLHGARDALQPHRVPPGVDPPHPVVGVPRARVAPQPRQVHRALRPQQHPREQRGAVHRGEQRRQRRITPGGGAGWERRVEQGLHVHDHRVLAVRHQVLVVDVGAVHQVQQGQQGALPAVEAVHPGQLGARQVLDELGPPVAPAGQLPHRPQSQVRYPGVHPVDQAGEAEGQVDGARLVDDPPAVGEVEHGHGPPAPMPVTHPRRDPHQRTGIGAPQQGGDDRRPVPQVAAHQFGRRLGVLGDGLGQQPGQHRVPPDEPGQAGPGRRGGEEPGEPGLGGRSRQGAPDAVVVQVQDEGAGRGADQPGAGGRQQPGANGVGIDQRGVGRRGQCGVQVVGGHRQERLQGGRQAQHVARRGRGAVPPRRRDLPPSPDRPVGSPGRLRPAGTR